MYKLENDVQWTNDLKNAFKHNVTRAKLLWESNEINENNHLKDLTLDEQYYISNLGFVGAAAARKLEVNLIESNFDINLENKELELKIGADYEGNTYYINYGKFIVDKPPENDETNGTIRIVAYDYMIKFNKPYIAGTTFPCTLLQLTQDICNQAGVVLGSTDFANKNFIVEDNQFDGFTLREVLQHIAKCAFSWARIGQDNKLYLDFDITPETTETITINDYKVNSFKKANEYYGPVNQVTYADSDIEGQEEKVPSTPPVGELKELVIYDNLFAYTPEKRSELIQTGTRLLGLTYMPISQLELIGLAYLDCRDAIAVETLAEETFTSRVFSHQIQYNGTLHDSIVTEGSSSNEEAYKNTATNAFQNQQTRIKVDRANKNISLLVQEVDEQNDKISDLEITTEGIEAEVSNIYSPTRHVEGIREIILPNSVKGYLVKLRIKGNNSVFDYLYPEDDLYPENTLYPRGDSRIVVTNKDNVSTVYELRVNEVLRANEEVYDEYILENNFAKVIRRVNPDGTTKELETVENIGTYTIYVDDGTNTIRIQNYSAPIEAMFVEKNAYTNQFATTIEMNSAIELAENEINLSVNRKIDDETTGANILLKINNDQSEATINADKINLNGVVTANNNFKINTNGTMECTGSKILNGNIFLQDNGDEGQSNFWIRQFDGENVKADMFAFSNFISTSSYTLSSPISIATSTMSSYEDSANLAISTDTYQGTLSATTSVHTGDKQVQFYLTKLNSNDYFYLRVADNVSSLNLNRDNNKILGYIDDSNNTVSFMITDGTNSSTIYPNVIYTPQVIQTSKESVKKNIEKYLDNASDIVKNSEIYTYNFKSEKDNDKKHIGFVIGDEGGKYKTPDEVISNGEGIDNYAMTSILWKAFQEQQKIIEDLKKEINNLKGGI